MGTRDPDDPAQVSWTLVNVATNTLSVSPVLLVSARHSMIKAGARTVCCQDLPVGLLRMEFVQEAPIKASCAVDNSVHRGQVKYLEKERIRCQRDDDGGHLQTRQRQSRPMPRGVPQLDDIRDTISGCGAAVQTEASTACQIVGVRPMFPRATL